MHSTWIHTLCLALLVPSHVVAWKADAQASRISEYVELPPLREQAALQDAWTTERRSKIPDLLQKYGIDAWLVRLSIPRLLA